MKTLPPVCMVAHTLLMRASRSSCGCVAHTRGLLVSSVVCRLCSRVMCPVPRAVRHVSGRPARAPGPQNRSGHPVESLSNKVGDCLPNAQANLACIVPVTHSHFAGDYNAVSYRGVVYLRPSVAHAGVERHFGPCHPVALLSLVVQGLELPAPHGRRCGSGASASSSSCARATSE